MCVCVCVCVLRSRAGGKFLLIKIVPPAHPSVKPVPWSCTGEQSTLAVPHGPLMVLVGLRVPTPAVGGTVSTPASSLPGLQEIASHRHIVPA